MFSSLPKEQSFERIINAGTKHWLLFINKILVLQITYLLNHLIQLSKNWLQQGNTAVGWHLCILCSIEVFCCWFESRFSTISCVIRVQFCIARQVHFFHKYGFDEYADGTVLEKLWPLIAQNEPSLISLQLVILLLFEFPSRLVCYPAKWHKTWIYFMHLMYLFLYFFRIYWVGTLWYLLLYKLCLENLVISGCKKSGTLV